MAIKRIDLRCEIGVDLVSLLRDRREGGEYGTEVRPQPLQGRLVASVLAGHDGAVHPMIPQNPVRDVLVEVVGGIGKGREDQDLAIAGIDRAGNLAADQLLEAAELLIPFNVDVSCVSEQPGQIRWSSCRSCFQRMRSTSCSNTLTLVPTR